METTKSIHQEHCVLETLPVVSQSSKAPSGQSDNGESLRMKSDEKELSQKCEFIKLIHFRDDRYVCTACNFKNKMQSLFAQHLENHKFADIYSCMYCPTASTDIDNIRMHFAEVHPNDSVKYATIAKLKIRQLLMHLIRRNADSYERKTSDINNPKISGKPDEIETNENSEISVENNSVNKVQNASTVVISNKTKSIDKSTDKVDNSDVIITSSFGNVTSPSKPEVINVDSQSDDEDIAITHMVRAKPKSSPSATKKARLECGFAAGKYQCVTCIQAFCSTDEDEFSRHISSHMHNGEDIGKMLCPIKGCNKAECPYLKNMMTLLIRQKIKWKVGQKKKESYEKDSSGSYLHLSESNVTSPMAGCSADNVSHCKDNLYQGKEPCLVQQVETSNTVSLPLSSSTPQQQLSAQPLKPSSQQVLSAPIDSAQTGLPLIIHGSRVVPLGSQVVTHAKEPTVMSAIPLGQALNSPSHLNTTSKSGIGQTVLMMNSEGKSILGTIIGSVNPDQSLISPNPALVPIAQQQVVTNIHTLPMSSARSQILLVPKYIYQTSQSLKQPLVVQTKSVTKPVSILSSKSQQPIKPVSSVSSNMVNPSSKVSHSFSEIATAVVTSPSSSSYIMLPILSKQPTSLLTGVVSSSSASSTKTATDIDLETPGTLATPMKTSGTLTTVTTTLPLNAKESSSVKSTVITSLPSKVVIPEETAQVASTTTTESQVVSSTVNTQSVGIDTVPNQSQLASFMKDGSIKNTSGKLISAKVKSSKLSAVFRDGLYHCLNCMYKTPVTRSFRKHLWKDIHPKNKCNHTKESNKFVHCTYVNQMMAVLEIARVNASLVSDQVTEVSGSVKYVSGQINQLSTNKAHDEVDLKSTVIGKEFETGCGEDVNQTTMSKKTVQLNMIKNHSAIQPCTDKDQSETRPNKDHDNTEIQTNEDKKPTDTKNEDQSETKASKGKDQSKIQLNEDTSPSETKNKDQSGRKASKVKDHSEMQVNENTNLSETNNKDQSETKANKDKDHFESGPSKDKDHLTSQLSEDKDSSVSQPSKDEDNSAKESSKNMDQSVKQAGNDNEGNKDKGNQLPDTKRNMSQQQERNDILTFVQKCRTIDQPNSEKKQEKGLTTVQLAQKTDINLEVNQIFQAHNAGKTPNLYGDDEADDQEMTLEIDKGKETDALLASKEKREEMDFGIQIENVVGSVGLTPPISMAHHDMDMASDHQFQCSFCPGISTDSDITFKMHCTTYHQQEKILPCAYCDLCFGSEDFLIRHILEQHSRNLSHTYQCTGQNCHYSTNFLKDLERHIVDVHKEQDGLKCHFCQKVMSSCDMLIRHVKDSVTKVVKCPVCGICSETKQSVVDHIHLDHPNVPLQTISEVSAACAVKFGHKTGPTSASDALFRRKSLSQAAGTLSPADGCQQAEQHRPSILVKKHGRQPGSQNRHVCACGQSYEDVTSYQMHTANCIHHKTVLQQEIRTSVTVHPSLCVQQGTALVRNGSSPRNNTISPDATSPRQGASSVSPLIALSRHSTSTRTASPQMSGSPTPAPRMTLAIRPPSCPPVGRTIIDLLDKNMNITKCDCNFMTCFKLLMDEHLKIHSQKVDATMPFRCQHCPFTSDSLEYLHLHCLCHEASRKILRMYNCSVCQLTSTSQEFIEDHMIEAHPDNDVDFACKSKKLDLMFCPVRDCDGRYASELALIEHLSSAHGEHAVVKYVKGLYGIEIAVSDMQLDPASTVHQVVPVRPTPAPTPRTQRVNAAFEEIVMSPAQFETTRTKINRPQFNRGNSRPLETVYSPTVPEENEEGVVDRALCCTYCNFSSNDLDMWKKHQEKHIGEGSMTFSVFFCEMCDWPATDKKKMIDHCIKEHLMAVAVAKEKGYETRSVEVSGHGCIEERENQESDIADSWELPDTSANTIYSFHCELCEFSTNERTLLNNHVVECHNMPGYATAEPITVGLAKSPSPEVDRATAKFKCRVCPYFTDKTKHFKNHERTHEKQSKIMDGFKCPYCVQTFTTHGNARAHHNRYHSDVPFDLLRVLGGIVQAKSLSHMQEIVVEPASSNADPSATISQVPSGSSKAIQSLLQKPVPPGLPDLPDENIFPEAVKCPKCNDSFKVRVSLLKHWKKHEEAENRASKPDIQEITSISSESVESDGEGTLSDNVHEVEEDIEDEDDSDSDPDGEQVEDDGEEEDVTNGKAKATEDQTKYCTRVPKMDLYKCTKCAFLHKYPSKVLRHFRYKHEKFCPYSCGYCNFVAVESPKIRRHCLKMHSDEPIRILDISANDPSTVSSAVSLETEKGDKTVVPTISDTANTDEGNQAINEATVDRAERAAAQGVQQELTDIVAKFIIKGAANIQTCLICGYCQEGASSVKRHLFAIHLNYHPYKCKYCDFKAVERNKVIKHLNKNHEGLEKKIVRRKYHGTLPEVNVAPTTDTNKEISAATAPSNNVNGDWVGDCGSGLMISGVASVTDPETEGTLNVSSRDGEVTTLPAGNSKSGSECGAFSEESCDMMQPICIKPEPGYEEDAYGQMPEGMFYTEDNQVIHPPLAVTSDTASYSTATPSKEPIKKKITPYKSCKDGTGVLKRCKYCTYKTVWNLGDVKTHVIVTHMKKMPYGCKFCKHSSRDKRRLKEHCKTHGRTSMAGFRYMYNDYADIIEVKRSAAEVFVGIKGCENEEDLLRASRLSKMELEQMALEYDTAAAEERKALGLPANTKNIAINVRKDTLKTGSRQQFLGVISSASSVSNMNHMMQAMQKSLSPQSQTPQGGTTSTTSDGPKLTEKHIQCVVCGYVHFDRYKMKIHALSRHLSLKPYMCSVCKFGDYIYHRVRDHVKDAHPGMQAQLRRCIVEKEQELRQLIVGADLRKTASQSRFRVPQPKTNQFKPWGCHHCKQYRAYSKAKIRYHSIARHKGLPFKYIQYEKPKNVTPQPIAVEACQSKSVNNEAVDPAASSKCPHCELTFTNIADLPNHIRLSHANIGVFQCPYCPSRIRYKAKMKMHQIRKHPGLPMRFHLVQLSQKSLMSAIAKVPGLALSDQGVSKKPHLDVPFWRVRPQKRSSDIMIDHYTCKACTFVTKDQFAMRNHAQGHINYRPYKCPYCNYGNVKSFPIKLHVAKHHPHQSVSFRLAKDASKELELRELYTRPLSITKKMPAVHIPLEQLAQMPEETLEKLGDASSGFISMGAPDISHLPGMPENTKDVLVNQGIKLPQSEYSASVLPKGVDPMSITQPRSRGPVGNRPYCCKLCNHWSQNHTAIKRHLMWELRYLPYHCQHCTYKDVHSSGIESHCDRKHRGLIQQPVIRRNSQREKHIEELIDQSRVRPTRPSVQPFLQVKPWEKQEIKTDDVMPNAQKGIKSDPSFLELPVVKPLMPQNELDELMAENATMPTRLLKCRLCGFASQQAKTLLNHWVRHGPKRYQCTHCSFTGHYPYEIIKHSQKYHPKRPAGHRALKYERRSMKQDMEVLTGEAAQNEVERQIALVTQPQDPPQMSGNLDHGTHFFRNPMKANQCIIDGLIIPQEELEKSDSGEYKCRYCGYRNTAKEHYKNHLVRHMPPRWKCFYCKTKNQLSYDLMKHVRKTHPTRPAKIVKINPNSNDSQDSFQGRLVINGCPLRLVEVESKDMPTIDGVLYDTDTMSITSDAASGRADSGKGESISSDQQEKASGPSTNSSLTTGNLVYNCHMCAFSTRDTPAYVNHIQSHQVGDLDEDLTSVGTDNSREVSPDPKVHLTPEQYRHKLLQERGDLRVRLSNALQWPKALLDELLEQHGLTGLCISQEYLEKMIQRLNPTIPPTPPPTPGN